MRFPCSLVLLLLGLLPSFASAQEHPRLLFDAADIPDLRAKIQREPFASMYQELLSLKDVRDDSQYGPSYPAVRNGFLYVLTGDPTFAEDALAYVDETLALSGWADDSYKALGRAMLGKGVALAYDFCQDAWNPADRDRISMALKDNADSLMRSGGGGWPGDGATANNWHGVRYSGAILCYKACDEAGSAIDDAYTGLRNHLQAKYGTGPLAHGWDVEGIGYVRYPWGSFIGAAGIVLQRLEGIDMTADAPGAGYTLWAMWPGVLPLPSYNYIFNEPILGLHPDFSDDNPNFLGEGSHGLSFYYAPDGYKAGLRWMYDRIGGAFGDQTWDNYRHGTIYSILYYPEDIPAENPENVWGLYYEDERHGMVLFRDRYQDANDLVTQFNAKQLRPSNTHAGADLNGFRIFGLGSAWATGSGRTGRMGGQSTVFKSDPGSASGDSSTGQLLSYFYNGDGSGYADIAGSSTGVSGHVRRLITDYSGASGARGVWVIADRTEDGTLWRMNTPGMNTVSTRLNGFTITAPNGNRMEATILHPTGKVPSTGSFTRGSDFRFDSSVYQNNNYVQFDTGDGEFLVVLTVTESGNTAPTVTTLGGHGLDQHFTVGPETFAMEGRGLLVSGWTGGALAPYAGIDYPADNQYIRAGGDLLVEATANDIDGTVEEVQFYDGDTLLGSDNAPPYTYLWPSIPDGDPTIVKVVAVDDDGNKSIPTALSFRSVIPRIARARIEAESYDANNGFRSIGDSIGYLNNKGWTRYDAVDFGDSGPTSVTVEGSVISGGTCEFRLDSLTGPLVATVEFTGSGPFIATVDTPAEVTGIRDLYFKHESGGPGVANVDAFTFSGTSNETLTVSIDQPAEGSSFEMGEPVTISATAADNESVVTSVEFFADGLSLGTDNDGGDGWSVVWTENSAGSYSLSAQATNGGGDTAVSAPVSVTRRLPQSPFTGSPAPVPGRIEAEDYDLGGEGIAYSDTDSGNNGGDYRSDNVDIQATEDSGGGYNIGWIESGEWLEYTVEVATAGIYEVAFRVAVNSGGAIHLKMNGIEITESVILENTGDWQNWATVMTESLPLAAGEHVLRVAIDGSGFNLNYVDFSLLTPALATTARSSLSDDDLMVHFPTLVGARYRVMTSVDLTSWVEAGTVTGDGTEASMAVPFDAGSERIFARVEEVNEPQ